jgi:hypothetical protein
MKNSPLQAVELQFAKIQRIETGRASANFKSKSQKFWHVLKFIATCSWIRQPTHGGRQFKAVWISLSLHTTALTTHDAKHMQSP